MTTLTADSLRAAYAGLLRKRIALSLLLALAVFASLLLDISIGSSSIPMQEVLQALFSSAKAEIDTLVIVQELRLPFALMAVLVGIALALAGAEMQTVLDNPLADPFTLGLSSAAALGAAALAIVFELSLPGVPGDWMVAFNAFVFAFASVLLLQAFAQIGGGMQTLLLMGIALVFCYNAVVALLQYIASANALQQLVFWSLGSLTRSNWTAVYTLGFIVLLVLPFSLRSAWSMTALRLGEDRAQTLGVDVKRLRLMALLRISLLAATAVAFVGTIGFIGLVGPHIARMLIGEDHRFFLPVSAMIGALVMSLASIASKSIVTGVILPIGIVTALIGVPMFIALLLRRSMGR